MINKVQLINELNAIVSELEDELTEEEISGMMDQPSVMRENLLTFSNLSRNIAKKLKVIIAQINE